MTSPYILREACAPHVAAELERVRIDSAGDVDARGLFCFIGAEPRTRWLGDLVARDDRGYVLTGPDVRDESEWLLERDRYLLETSVPGIFACGDVRSGPVKRVASAVDRAGLRCFFTPRVAVHYYPRASLRGLFFQMMRYGRGRVRLLRNPKHPQTEPSLDIREFVNNDRFEGFTRRGIRLSDRAQMDLLRDILLEHRLVGVDARLALGLAGLGRLRR